MPPTIFIVDSSPAVRRMVEHISTPQGYDVVGFHDGPTALEAARRMNPTLIIADYHMANMTFSGFCTEIGKSDNLADTLLISLVDVGNRLDEQHLRTLGVRAFLTKPLHAEHVLDAIQSIQSRASRNAASRHRLKKRAWPPDSSATDLEDRPGDSLEADPPAIVQDSDPVEEMPLMASSPSSPSATAPSPPHHVVPGNDAGGEEALRGLLEYLFRTVSQHAEKKLMELVPRLIVQEMQAVLPKTVTDTVQNRLTVCLSDERIVSAVRGPLVEELAKQRAGEWSSLEQAAKQQVDAITPRLVEEAGTRLLRESLQAGLEQHVPAAVRGYLTSADALIKQEIQEAVARCLPQMAEDMVRKTALERVTDAVERIVPDIAETQVKAELRRLTAPE